MLILKEPIKLNSLSPLVSLSDGFFERMDANYKQLQATYSAEDLFHLLNQPPEILLEEGQMTTLVTQNHNQMNQEVRLEMIHNLFNRLMLSDGFDFTYRDTVFVQNMLEKLGVRNVSEFMQQIHELQEDTKNIKQLLNIYKSNTEPLSMIIQTVKSMEGKEEKETYKEEKNTFPIYWIHNEIFKRLQTGNVYHITAAFQKGGRSCQNSIHSREIEMAGHVHLSEALRLQGMENRVLLKENPLLWHRVNIYEEGLGEGSYEKEEIVRELAQAVLLNLSANIYETGLARQRTERKVWYQFQGDFHQILEDTLNRFSAYHFQGFRTVRRQSGNQYQKNVNTLRREEITQLNKILELYTKTEHENETYGGVKDRENVTFTWKEQNTEYETGHENVTETLENIRQTLLEEARESRKVLESRTEEIKLLEKRTEESHAVREELRETAEKKEERIHHVTGNEELQILQEINRTNETLEHNRELFEREREQERRLSEEVRLLNEQNRRRMEETELTEEVLQKITPVQINKERTRKETLMLLEHPELLETYIKEETEERIDEVQRQHPGLSENLAVSIEKTEQLYQELTKELEKTAHMNYEEAPSSWKLQEETREKVHEKLETFLTHLQTEKKTEEVRSISRLQEALSGKKPKGAEAGSTEAVSKRLTLLQSSLREIETKLGTSGTEQTKTRDFIREEVEPRNTYIKVLQQMEQIIKNYPVQEHSIMSSGENVREQQTLLLETLHTSEQQTQKETEKWTVKAEQTMLLQKEVRALERSIAEAKRSIGGNPVLPKKRVKGAVYPKEMQKMVLSYLDTVSRESKEEVIQKELVHIQKEELQNTVEQIKRQEQSYVLRHVQHKTSAAGRSVRLYHKEPDVFTIEAAENIVSPATVSSRMEEVNEQTHTQRIVTKQQVNTRVDQLVRKNSEHIHEMINRGVQRQLNTISEQVYHKLEKKLSSDRKRRGY